MFCILKNHEQTVYPKGLTTIMSFVVNSYGQQSYTNVFIDYKVLINFYCRIEENLLQSNFTLN